MSRTTDHLFVCSDCGATLAVDAAKKDALLAQGCVVCTTSVSPAEFQSPPDQGI